MDPPSRRVNRRSFKFTNDQPKAVEQVPKAVESAPTGKTLEGTPASIPDGSPVSGQSVVTPLRNMASTPAMTAASPKVAASLDLTGKIFCFATDLDSIPQEEVLRRIETAGGKVGLAISQRTSYLVLGGKMPDGRPAEDSTKYQRFSDLRAKGKVQAEVLREADFLKMLPAVESPSLPSKVKKDVRPSFQSQPSSQESSSRPFNWVDIFAPYKLDQLIGNNAAAQRLTDWLRDWEDVVLHGRKKASSRRENGGAENVNARAVLVSGPPGIGKTTTCRLVAEMHGGYKVLEYNASDARGQKVIQEMAEGIAQNSTVSFSGQGTSKRKAVIIMDEVDGMGAGDKGGNAALIKMIKTTRNPIICICNDQHGQKASFTEM
ncbi:unnamed protein product [Durusdinium trenchii]|uniref:AAA+ ATPase domain-containing protein n=1 Tax=Durusdinium trenchii TaxID=1381693 RepID=A0ABP0MNB1_9DINO